ncbi:MAG: molybdenum cofactor guanylyltransferase [Chlorobi bacterium]|nr:molybdenum cofactor guanylyltransferase [Chlorobiota bacterium]
MKIRKQARILTVILAGGQSRRMGRDKALMPCGNRSLIQRVAAEARKLGFPAVVSTAPGRIYPLTPSLAHVEDRYPGTGPLGAIVSVMETRKADYYLFWPVDMPLLTAEIWQRLLSEAEKNRISLLWPEIHGRVYPLPGIYSRELLPLLRENLQNGHLALYPLRRHKASKIIDFSSFSSYFANLNTPDDGHICE